MVQKVFGICEAKNGTEASELLLTGANGHQRIWQNAEKNSNFRGRQSPRQRDKGEKKRITRKQYQILLNEFEMEGLMAQKGLWNLAMVEQLAKGR